MSTETRPTAGRRPQPPPDLGLRAIFREPADRFEESAAEVARQIDSAQAALAENPPWRSGPTPAWTLRLSPGVVGLLSWLVRLLTLGRVRLNDPNEGPDPARWSLRRQLVRQRIPAIRHEIRAIRRLRRPIERAALDRELRALGGVRNALWWSPRAIRFHLTLWKLRLQIAAIWIWVNREALFFYGMIVLIFGLMIGLVYVLQQNQGEILDFVNDMLPSRSPLDDPFSDG
ncbi:MAG: hypothetical protein AB7P40_03375 [Chloroflexota bacterium]